MARDIHRDSPCDHGGLELALAHEQCCEARLAAEIDVLLDAGKLPDPALLSERFSPQPGSAPDVDVLLPPVSEYDDTCLAGGLS